MLDPVVKKYLFYKSPLHTQNGKIIFCAILAIIAVFSFLGWQALLMKREFVGLAIWWPYAAVGSIAGYFLLSFLDRERRIRPFHILTILAVMFVTGPAAAWLNGLNEATKLVTVGFVEESMKILPVLLLAIFIPNLIRSKKDGMVYGALAGMGFNIMEFAAYVYTLSHGGEYTVIQAIIQQTTRFGLWGFGSHLIWSAFAGLGIGYAMESTFTGFRKWRRFIVYYLLVAVAHSAFDLGALALAMLPITIFSSIVQGIDYNTIDAEVAKAQYGPVRDGMKYMHYLYNLIFLIVIFVQIKRSFSWENKIQVDQLSDEKNDVISEKELKLLKKEKFFTKRKYKNYSSSTGGNIILYQNLLAMQKLVMAREGKTQEGEDVANFLKDSIKILRQY